MLRKNPSGHLPQVSPLAYIDPTAIICGRVIVEDFVYVGPYAVIRADELNAAGDMEPIVIGSHSNIQDGVVIHSKSGAAVTIGRYSSIAHRAIVHGPCRIGDRVFIGFNSVLFNCHVQSGCVVRYNAVVDGVTLPENRYIPPLDRTRGHRQRSVALSPGRSRRAAVFGRSGRHQRRTGARLPGITQ